MEGFYLLPRIPDKKKVLQSFFHMNNMIRHLSGKHELIPTFNYKQITLSSIEDEASILSPINSLKLTREFLKGESFQTDYKNLLDDLSVETWELDEAVVKRNELVKRLGLPELVLQELSQPTKRLNNVMEVVLKNDLSNTGLIVPFFSLEQICPMIEIERKIHLSNDWLKQIISFFQFLTDERIVVDKDIYPTDFVFNKSGKVVAFLAYDCLRISKEPETSIHYVNSVQLGKFVDKYYREHYLANQNLGRNKDLIRVYPRLGYDTNTDSAYETFQQGMDDLDNRLEKQIRDKNIGVFIDYANIFKGLDPMRQNIHIDFERLFSKIYGHDNSKKITTKHVSIFLPTYSESDRNERVKLLEWELEEYFKATYNIQPSFKRNGKEKAKEIINGQEFDIDDQDLIEKMKNNMKVLDDILLMSGDKHFINIVREIKQEPQQKTVRIISVEKDTSQELKSLADSYQCLTDFWDCIKYKTT